MNLERRIYKLEGKMSKMYSDPNSEAALKEWLKLHPGYLVFAQPESNNGVIMPENISHTFNHILNRIFAKKNLSPNCHNLLKILDDLFESFNPE